ncbi:DNA-directed RNA polymerase [Lobaria immixta]|nr:DNA-directed RNA polymerase [Lobaria immixta]
MFARASKQRLQPDTYKQWQYSSETLHLPWLCPALCSAQSRFRKTSNIARIRSPKRLSFPRPSQFQPAAVDRGLKPRGLAFAAQAVQNTPQDDLVPWEMSPGHYQPPQIPRHKWLDPNSLSTLRPFNLDSMMVIGDMKTTRTPTYRSGDGISGNVKDITQTMLACIQVNRFERAARLMRRLNKIYKPGAPDLLTAHNIYLRELLHNVERTKDPRAVKDIHKWFEKDIRKAGVNPDASTFALMILATYQDSTGKDINRTIKRYISFAKDAGIWEDTRLLVRVISDKKDFQDVTQITPDHIDKIDQGQTQEPAKTLAVPEPIGSPPDNALGLPTVKATEMKGLGLVSLQRQLSMFSEQSSLPLSEDDGGMDGEKRKMLLLQRQKRLERDAYDSAISRWRSEHETLKNLGINTSIGQRSIGATLWAWHEKFVPWVEEEIRKVNEAEGKANRSSADTNRCLYGPFLRLLPVHKLSAITIMTCIFRLSDKKADHRGLPLSKLVTSVGAAVEDEIAAEKIKNGSESSGPNVDLAQRFGRLSHVIKNRHSQKSIAKLLASSELFEQQEHVRWTSTTKARVGAVLISCLVEIAKIDVRLTDPRTGAEHRESQPAFVHGYLVSKGKNLGVLRFNKAFFEKLSKEPVGGSLPRFLPMVVEPRPWTGFTKGAFLAYSRKVIRIKNDYESTRYATTASGNGDMKQIFAGLDILGKTPWRVNRGLLEVMLRAWDSGEAFGKLPPEDPKFDYPPEPDVAEGIGLRRKWLSDMKAIENKRAGVKSERCFYNFQLEIARAYADETIYFPHSVDFRGRAYPMVPLFNHMGADPCRSLLVFAKGKKLGEGGLGWLRIHLAGLYGFDKASFEERRKFTEEHISDILDSATNPLGGKRWWLQAEDPWQCLGACMELKKALDEPDPRQFVSHLPIHQDGTCNGLQHYAALGGDVAGAKEVNLEPGDRPSDIYTGVAEIVKAEVTELAAQGNELARLLDGKLTRKVVKQTVMTNVYGVTYMGAKIQVRNQLDKLLPDFPNTISLNLQTASALVTRLIFKTLSSMFLRAHEIQRWFGDCAATISQAVSPPQIKRLQDQVDGKVDTSSQFSKAGLLKTKPWTEKDLFKTSIIWTTPLKMPVVQPYRKCTVQQVNTHMQSLSLSRSSSSSDPVSKQQQRRAFAPNFIHSLDATHMILTALKCNEVGLSFAAVHDSFWTHPCDVDIMNRIIRDAFIRMHSEDIMGRLRAEFSARYKGYMHLASVDRSSAVGQKIEMWRQSTLSPNLGEAGRKRKVHELLMENRRLRLLASENPEERAEGESMVTAGQIFQGMANEKDLTHLNDICRLGQLPPETVLTDSAEVDLENEEDKEFEGHEQLDVETRNEIDQESEVGDTNDTGEKIRWMAKKSAGKKVSPLWIWLPVTFPPVPEKVC